MEAETLNALLIWADRWADLVDFKIVPVLTSQDYWKNLPSGV
jgi:hypothetical protein